MLIVTSVFLNKYLSRIFPKWRKTHIAYVQHQRSTTKRLDMLPTLLPSSRIPLYMQSDSIGRNSNLENTNFRINSLENQISLSALIKSLDPKRTQIEHFQCCSLTQSTE